MNTKPGREVMRNGIMMPLILLVALTSACVVDTQGVEGASCWDTNGNGFEDPAEDMNGDTVWDARDCVGVSHWLPVESGIHYSDGFVGIGESNPSFPIHIQGAGAAVAIESHSDDGLTCPAISFRRRRGSPDSPSIVKDGDLLGALYFNGYDDDSSFPSASIIAEVDGATGPSLIPSRLTFLTRSGDAAASAPIERVRIDSSGSVGIGTPAPGALLHVAGQVHIDTGPTNPDSATLRFLHDGALRWGLLSDYPSSGEFSIHNYATNESAVVLNDNGDVGVGITVPDSKLHVNGDAHVNGYIQLDTLGGSAPPSSDCSSESHYGRMKVDEVNKLLYICAVGGWISK